MTIFGVDISHNQTGIDLERAASGDTVFLAAKVTEGRNYQDPAFDSFRRQAEAQGLLFAAYHYLRGDSSPVEQALNTLAALEDPNVPVIIDLERTNGSPQPNMVHARAYRNAIVSRGGKVAGLLYLPEWYWSEIGRPDTSGWDLWASSYGGNAGSYPGDSSSRWNHEGGKTSVLQFTSAGRVAGYSGNIDVNAYKGTRDELAQTGWFFDYRLPQEPDLPTKDELQQWVASTPIVIDAEGTTQPLQRVLRRLLIAQTSPADIAKAVVKALPTSGGTLTQAQVEEAVKQAFREGTA